MPLDESVDANAIEITEFWQTKEDHGRSPSLPAVRTAIDGAKPRVAAMQTLTKTVTIGG